MIDTTTNDPCPECGRRALGRPTLDDPTPGTLTAHAVAVYDALVEAAGYAGRRERNGGGHGVGVDDVMVELRRRVSDRRYKSLERMPHRSHVRAALIRYRGMPR